MQATTKDLRLRTPELIATTQRGEEVVITYRGKPCVRLVPEDAARRRAKRSGRNPAFGLWADRSDTAPLSVEEHVRSLRAPRQLDQC